MKRSKRELDELLDDATAEVRSEKLSDELVARASQRVWERLKSESAGATEHLSPVEHLRTCDDFQSLIPVYLAGSLTASRTLLLEDHFSECVPCRRALKEARHGNEVARQLAFQKEKLERSTSRLAALKWGIAAAAVLTIGLLVWPLWQRLSTSSGVLNGVVEAADGEVYRVTDQRTEAVRAGGKVLAGERLRTAAGGRALVRFSDGSTVELGERGEFGFAATGEGTTLRLDRGALIVETATASSNRLIVATDETRVAASGTIFAVNHGTKGDRLSVVDGEVSLDQFGQVTKPQTLKPGEQLTTHLSIERVPIRQEISWSRNAAKYQQLLDQVAAVRQQIDQQVALPGSRFSTQLLDLMPERTAIYLGLPNISATLAEAERVLTENIEKSSELKAWWEKEQSTTPGQSGRKGITQAIEFARDFGSYLGAEITFGAEIDPQQKRKGDFLVLAELRDATGLRDFIGRKLAAVSGGAERVVIVDDPRTYVVPAATVRRDERLYVWIGTDLLAASPRIEALQRLAERIESPAARSFTANPFHAQISAIYREGAGLLIAADLESLIIPALEADQNSADETAFARQIGFDNLRYFIVEVKEKEGRPYNRVVVSFKQQAAGQNTGGITAWLAAPGPMGTLEYISPKASLVSAFVVKEPTAIVDDLIATLRSTNPKLWDEFVAFQAGQGIDLRRDLAEPLGSEYALAIDGPILPIPSWKAIFEVDDPERLQQTIELLVGRIDQQLKAQGKLGLALTKEVDGEKTFYKIKSLDFGLEADYIFTSGYLIAAPSRPLVENAIRFRENGNSILQSPKFKATLPEDKQANFSAIVYQDLGSLSKTIGKLAGEKGATINSLLSGKAGLAYVYAFEDRMIFSVNSEDGPIGISPSDFLALPGATGLGAIFSPKK